MDIVVSLIRKCKNDDKYAYNDLLGRYEGQLYRICYSYTRNREASLDIMQEVYIKIYRSIQTFDESRPFYPWVKRITVNTCLNYIRDQKKHNQLSLDDDTHESGALKETIADRTDIEEITCANDFQKIIDNSLLHIPENYRMVLTLRYVEEMSYEQIATALNQSLGTVKSNISRGRKLLKQKLTEQNILEV
ncbi:RNA polymerase sigma factor [Evansella tamaricis]|uniref:RNA polymerase sigma factor n=1 Tax=Evansella tamaricis TaxID=2069301 RepID=A0ABS6JQ26_9BACI|nr:RNA polymerase sigma factor [Evansella tamaricis]MBU9714922.1 RNA polymerase sigma factor [Evansella tamaricis]